MGLTATLCLNDIRGSVVFKRSHTEDFIDELNVCGGLDKNESVAHHNFLSVKVETVQWSSWLSVNLTISLPRMRILLSHGCLCSSLCSPTAVGLSLAHHKGNGNEPLKCISESSSEERNRIIDPIATASKMSYLVIWKQRTPSLRATETESSIVSQ